MCVGVGGGGGGGTDRQIDRQTGGETLELDNFNIQK